MALFYAKVRKADKMVVETTVLNETQASKFPTDADVSLEELTEAQYGTVQEGRFHPGSTTPKFRFAGGNLIVTPDSRPVVSFTPIEIKAEVGEAVTVEISHPTMGTGLRELTFDGTPTRVDFRAGKATVTIDTSLPGQFFIRSRDDFRVTAPLEVTVFTRKLGHGL